MMVLDMIRFREIYVVDCAAGAAEDGTGGAAADATGGDEDGGDGDDACGDACDDNGEAEEVDGSEFAAAAGANRVVLISSRRTVTS